ncbi:hypothetical protein ANABIO32_03040 [Rossellomorea marisflavi]|uniref:dynamin family protein n=1 Tax=Rossellomorea marisflavi TaxID=189381 RepID=UPI0025CB605A|nr:dynamin family protein [Rossellomorea marisflavi]GLI82617.1 hypothetical protein ANABIO32_03040 [Rossellomorea marisflavi]
MTFSLEGFSKSQSRLVEQMDRLHDLLGDMKLEVEQKKVMEMKRSLLDEKFQVVVVGEFSRGKSTFINALLGDKILPSSPKPTTTILNRVVYGDEPDITLHFHKESKRKKLTSEAFARLVAPRDPLMEDKESVREYEEQVDYIQTISHAEIAHPLPFTKNGVEIIDTPGTNDLDPAREAITNTIIPESDAAILILSAQKILSESELGFLRDRLLANDIQKIFVVVNFKDQLQSEEEEQKVMEFASQHLKHILHDPKIFMVAAKQALYARLKENKGEIITRRGRPVPVWELEKTGFLELEQSLAHFLQNERGATKLQKPIKQITHMIKDIKKKHIAQERMLLGERSRDLKAEVRGYRPELTRLKQDGKQVMDSLSVAFEDRKKDLFSWYEKELDEVYRLAMGVFRQNRYMEITDIVRLVEDKMAPLERDLHTEKQSKIMEQASDCVRKATATLSDRWVTFEGKIWNAPEIGSSVPAEKNVQVNLFDNVVNDVSAEGGGDMGAWGWVALGAGFFTGAIGWGLAAILGAGWHFLTKKDEKEILENKLRSRFQAAHKQKLSSFKKEWEAWEKRVNKQLSDSMDERFSQIDAHFNHLLELAELKDHEIGHEMERLVQREDSLTSFEDVLPTIYQDLKGKIVKEVGSAS